MALILIRGENNTKLLNVIADVERHAHLTLSSKPKQLDSKFADSIVEKILKSKLRNKSKVACAFFTREDPTVCILQIKKIHPPAHIVIVSDEYKEFSELKNKLNKAPNFEGYYSHKSNGTKLKDYKKSTDKKKVVITNKIDSYKE